ncbi:MAG TPA: hypothetical protein VHV52_09210 [Gaiellaceae bacterium]|nr:hypothetical protein [Gaiellaceae bacterium]
MQLFEELVVTNAKIRERALSTRELPAERRDLGGKGDDARIAIGYFGARRVDVHERLCMQ